MNPLQNRILQHLEAILTDDHHFLVELKMSPNNGLLTVLLDGDTGVSIDYCALVSRALGEKLDEMEELGKYVLEVSSPGADAPLRLLRQYPKHVGRKLKLALRDETELEATLTAVNDDQLILAYSHKEKGKKAELRERSLSFADIKTAKVIISFK